MQQWGPGDWNQPKFSVMVGGGVKWSPSERNEGTPERNAPTWGGGRWSERETKDRR